MTDRPSETVGPYSISEVGRNLHEIKSEQRQQRETMSAIQSQLAAMPAAAMLLEERQRGHDDRIARLERRDEQREVEAASARRWLIASIVVPIFGLVAGPVIAVLVAGALRP